jgi:hypothetical protein
MVDWIPYRTRNFLTPSMTISFPRTIPHEVIHLVGDYYTVNDPTNIQAYIPSFK